MNAEGTPVVSPLDAVPDMRTTAKWILAAAAAVGAALLGASPLAAVGRIHDIGAAIAAYFGLVIGLAGVGWAVWCTADALIPPLTTPKSLDTDPRLNSLRAQIATDPSAFYGPFGENMADLRTALELHLQVTDNLAAALAKEPDPARQELLIAKLTEARNAVAAISRRIQTLLELSHAWNIRAQLRRARAHTFGGAALTALGVVIFLAATSTGSAPTPTSPIPSISRTASPAPS